jgi:hypothetical protein
LAEQQLLNIQQQQPVANIPVSNTFNISVDPSNLKEMEDQTVDEIAKQLPQVGSKVNQALASALSGTKQVRRV